MDLGSAPLSNAYLTERSLKEPEKWYPLRVFVCTNCWLVQTEDFNDADELFAADYAYFSSFSTSWLRHAENYTACMTRRFALDKTAYVVEIASNDGYLLQYFASRDIPCLGIEPTAGTAAAARKKGIEVREDFFGTRLAGELASQRRQADLMIANNVLAHVPDINDFVSGFPLVLKPAGVATFEFPHLLCLVADNQFDTIYHEHFSYLSLTAVIRVFELNGLSVFDVEELPTHGGSLRVYAQRNDTGIHTVSPHVREMLEREDAAGIRTHTYYEEFQTMAEKVKDDFIRFLMEAKQGGKLVIAYGAAAKGNTLINYAGIRRDMISCVIDRNPAKQGNYLPGSRIPIVDEESHLVGRPDYVVILPWNIKEEVITQLSYMRDWGSKFVTVVPSLRVTS